MIVFRTLSSSIGFGSIVLGSLVNLNLVYPWNDGLSIQHETNIPN
jgi:hypothetical protein